MTPPLPCVSHATYTGMFVVFGSCQPAQLHKEKYPTHPIRNNYLELALESTFCLGILLVLAP
jgi:hypothetical protein